MRELAEALKKRAGLRMRQGVVTAVDGVTCSVLIGGSTVPVDGVQHLNSCAPAVADVVWIASDGADLWIIGTHGDPPPIDPGRLPDFDTYFSASDPAGNPAAVTGLEGVAMLSGVMLSWDLPVEVMWRSWEIYEGTTTGFAPGTPKLVATTTFVTLPNDAESGPWYYKVRAVNSRGEKSPYVEVGPFTLPTPVPDGSLTAAQFAPGISTLQTVDALPPLPNPNYPPGTAVYVASEGRIYRVEPAPDLIPTMTSNVLPGGVASASSTYAAGYEPWRAFDKGDATAWASSASGTPWVVGYQFAAPWIVVEYGITTFTNLGECPKTWTFEGSDDGISWHAIDTRTNVPDWQLHERRTFMAPNETAYSRYRLNVTANSGSAYCTIQALEMMGYSVPTAGVATLPAQAGQAGMFLKTDGEHLAWGVATGPQGPKGDVGPAGYTPIKGYDYFDGAIGPQGETGETGAQGQQGVKGATGDTGATGAAGADSTVPGPQGVKGDTGDTGAQGVKGDPGVKGDTGAQGAQGIKGDTGAQGAPGADSTVPGPQGPKGDTGNTGAQGIQGVKGDTGEQGPAGTITAPTGTGFFHATVGIGDAAAKLVDINDLVAALQEKLIPSGLICQWEGAIADIPAGWHLADGTIQGGRTLPDLRDKFVVGAGGAYARGATGGEATHALTTSEIPSHSHAIDHDHASATSGNDNSDHTHSGTTSTVSSDHSHSGTTGGQSVSHSHDQGSHRHAATVPVVRANAAGTTSATGRWGTGASREVSAGDYIADFTSPGSTGAANQDHSHGFTTGGISANHTHTLTTGGRSAYHQHVVDLPNYAGASGAFGGAGSPVHNNLPPYYALAYIVKL